MKTDVMVLQNDNANLRDVLDKVELMALYSGMGRRESSAMCLVAEEMIVATQNIIDAYDASVWMDVTDKQFAIHLMIEAAAFADEREKLLKLSKSGKNSRAKGFFGYIANTLGEFFMPGADVSADRVFAYGSFIHDQPMYDYGFTYRDYQENVVKPGKNDVDDELEGVEKSIIDVMVDDITVGVSTSKIELVAIKNLKKES